MRSDAYEEITEWQRPYFDAVLKAMENAEARPNVLYWEDVEIGDSLGKLAVPPFSLQDQITGSSARSILTGRYGTSGDELAFEPVYHHNREGRGGYGRGFAHPITRWPHGPGDEHADALMAAYRGQPGPFDGGQHRSQIPYQLISNWMGDDGFVRRYQCAVAQEGDTEPGGTPGKADYHAVGIRLEGTNQVGEVQMQGTISVYLPSREGGPVQLPVPHSGTPPYVPYDTFYRDWF